MDCREKAIKEMAKIMCDRKSNCDECDNFSECVWVAHSVVLYDEGYRKLSLDIPKMLIIPKTPSKGNIFRQLEVYGVVDANDFKLEIIPTRQEIEKETAKKILKEIRGYYPVNKEYCDKGELFILDLCNDIAKQFGVEVDDCGK